MLGLEKRGNKIRRAKERNIYGKVFFAPATESERFLKREPFFKRRRRGLYYLAGILLVCSILFFLANKVYGQEGGIELLAGAGGFQLKDGAALEAEFRFPYGLAVDEKGNLLIADSYSHAVRKLAEGKVTTITGGNELLDAYGFPFGEYRDGNVTTARFYRPRDVAVDSKGTIYILDTGNHSIRKISEDKVFTLAGNGSAGYKNGKAGDAAFNHPTAMVIDSEDHIYVADTLNHCIRKITPAGEVSLYAGIPGEAAGYRDGGRSEARFNEPAGLALDASGHLYVADSGNQVIRKIDAEQVTTFAGGAHTKMEGTDYYAGGYRDGRKENARFNFPKGITVTGNGTVIVADTWNHRIRAIQPDGKVITLGGTGKPGEIVGPVTQAMFNGPADVVYHGGYLYIADMWNNAIKRMQINENHLQGIGEAEAAEIQFEAPSEAIQVWIDGRKLNFPDVQPSMEEGSVLAPLRFICEAWGAEVKWQEEARQISIKRENRELTLSADEAPAFTKEDRTLAPIRYLAENLGFTVEWVDAYRAVVVFTR